VHATFQSETEQDDEEAIVLFDPFETRGFENTSMKTLHCEIVHDVSCSYLQGDYEPKLTSIHSYERRNDSPQTNF